MKKLRILKSGLLIISLTVVMAGFTACGDSSPSGDAGFTGKVTILSTNDRHSHYLGRPYDLYDPTVTGDGTVGGAARMATVFDGVRASNPDTFIFDAGDFMDATIFITAENGAGDLNMLTKLGYDAACLGNHEMGMGPEELARMINNAKKDSSGRMVPLLCANIQFSSEDTPLGRSDDALEALYGNEGETGKYIFPYIIRTTPSGVRTGIFGLIGQNVFMPDAAPCSFPVDYSKIQELVNRLRDIEKVDAVICLKHASFSVNEGVAGGEIAELAKNVSGIDVICAGHSHTRASANVSCEIEGANWITTIIEAGDDTEHVGQVEISFNKGAIDTSLTAASIIAVNDTITGKPEIISGVNVFITDIETNYLTNFPQLKSGKLFDVLAHSDFSFGEMNSMNMVSDGMRAASGADVALCTPGADTARVRLNSANDITVFDAFHAMPHNMGSDGLHGGALYRFNFLAAELQGVLELGTCNLGQSDRDLFVLPSGVKIIYDTSQLTAGTGPGYIIKMYLVSPDELTETLIFDRSDPTNFPHDGWMYEGGTDGGPGDPYQIISVSTSLLTLIGLKYVSESMDDVDLWPRDNTGTPVVWETVSDLDQFIVKDGSDEVKAWYSVAQYLDSFGGTVPDRYDDTYTDGSTNNPIGPEWRRVWDINAHPIP